MGDDSQFRRILVLRNTWYQDDDNFGLLRNRVNNAGNNPKVNLKNLVFISYTSVIEWNGNIYLCCHDWQNDNKLNFLIFGMVLFIENIEKIFYLEQEKINPVLIVMLMAQSTDISMLKTGVIFINLNNFLNINNNNQKFFFNL